MAILAPTVSLSDQMPHYGIRVNITNPASTPPATSNRIERRDVIDTDWRILGTVAANTNFVDYGAAIGVVYDYRVIAIADDGTTATSTIVSGTVPEFTEWQLKDLDAISDSMEVDIANDRLEVTSEEVQAAFNTIGGKWPLVVKDEFIKGEKWSPEFDFLSYPDKQQFEKLRGKQKVLLLQAPFLGMQWFFVFGNDGRWTTFNVQTPWIRFTCGIIQVGRP